MSTFDVKLQLDIKGALASMKQFSEQSSDALQSLTGTLNLVKGAIVAIGGALAFHKIIEEATAADDAFTKLNIALKLSGDYSDAAVEQFEDFASTLQRTTRYSDEQALSSITMAKNFGLSNSEAQRLAKTAANLATITGQDLDSATQTLIKSYSGTTKELARLIPQVKALTEADLASGAAIDLVAKRFDGAAEAFGNTFGGSVQIAKNQFSDLLEVLGQFITRNPVVIRLIQAFGEAFGTIGQFLIKNKALINDFITGALVGMTNAFPSVIGAVQFLVNLLGGMVKIMGLATIGAIELVTVLLKTEYISVFVNSLVRGFGLIATAILQFVSLLTSIPGVGKTLEFAGLNVDKFRAQIDSITADVLENTLDVSIAKAADGLLDLGAAAAKGMDKVDSVLGGLNKGLTAMKSGAQGLAVEITKIGANQVDALKQATAEIQNQVKVIQTLTRDQSKKITETVAKDVFGGLLALLDPSKSNVNLPIDPTTGKPIQGSRGAVLGGAALGGLQGVLGGAGGAKSLLSSLAGTAADAFFPGAGAAVSAIVGSLSEGPEKVREMVRDFVKALPELVKAIIKAIPVLIVELIKGVPQIIRALSESIPELIEGIIEALPEIINGLIAGLPAYFEAMITSGPRVIEGIFRGFGKLFGGIATDGLQIGLQRFADGLMKLPERLIQAVADGISNIFKGLQLPGLGDLGGGGGLGSVAKGFLGFATGGLSFAVPSLGFKGTAGEGLSGSSLVAPALSKSTSSDAPAAQVDNGIMAKIQKIETTMNELRGGQMVVNLQIGEKNLASAILDLNRMGFRTA